MNRKEIITMIQKKITDAGFTAMFSTSAGFFILIFVACSSQPQNTTPSTTQEEPRTAYTEEAEATSVTAAAAQAMNARDFVEIKFAPGSSKLSDFQESTLKRMLDQDVNEKSNQLIILSWADQEYPSKKTERLSFKHRNIAGARNESILRYIRAQGSNVVIENHNMAERPNTLAQWFNTDDNKIKSALSAAGLPTTADTLPFPSKASHAVILIIKK